MSLGWASLCFVFLFSQSATAFYMLGKLKREQKNSKSNAKGRINMRDIKYGDKGGSAMLIAKRTVGNYLEQSPIFLVSLWLTAVFVDAGVASTCGWIWIASRVFYPFGFSKGIPYLFMSTFPAYGAVWYMMAMVLLKVAGK